MAKKIRTLFVQEINEKNFSKNVSKLFTLASTPWNEFFTNGTVKQREMQAWRAMLTHAGCTNITLFNKDKSSVSHIINVFFMSEINFFTHIIIFMLVVGIFETRS